MDTLDRRERTIYVSGMHPSVSEEILYDLFQQAGPVEKVVLHEYPDGSPRHALIVFKHVESVMYGIAKLNGTSLFDRPLSMRPLRESTHAAVLQQVMANQRRPLQMTNQHQESIPPTPPTSPMGEYHRLDDNKGGNDGGSEASSVTAGGRGGPPPLNQLQNRQDYSSPEKDKVIGSGRQYGNSAMGSPIGAGRPKDTQMWKKYTAGASSAATGGISDWFPANPGLSVAGYQGSGGGHMGAWSQGPGAPPPGFCAPIPPNFTHTARYQVSGRNCNFNPFYAGAYDQSTVGGGQNFPGTEARPLISLPHTAAYYSGINGAWAK